MVPWGVVDAASAEVAPIVTNTRVDSRVAASFKAFIAMPPYPRTSVPAFVQGESVVVNGRVCSPSPTSLAFVAHADRLALFVAGFDHRRRCRRRSGGAVQLQIGLSLLLWWGRCPTTGSQAGSRTTSSTESSRL